jgi:hypothetical protein
VHVDLAGAVPGNRPLDLLDELRSSALNRSRRARALRVARPSSTRAPPTIVRRLSTRSTAATLSDSDDVARPDGALAAP